jgi:hypothetical protein
MTNLTLESKFIHSKIFGENFSQNQVKDVEIPKLD